MKKTRKVLILITLLTLVVSTQVIYAQGDDNYAVTGQHIKFKRLTSENGLSNDSIWGIAQDSDGFMWFGTFDGLNRYDGHDFKIYRHDPDDPHSLSDNTLRGLLVDHSGALWVGTWGKGLNQFDRSTERFIRYQHNPDDPHSLSNDAIRTVYEDPAGTLWVGTMGGLNKFERDTKQFTRYLHDPDDPHSLSHNTVWSVYQDRAGVLWVGTEHGLDQFDPETGQFTHYRHNPDDPHSLSHNNVRSICEDRSGVLWVGTYGGLNQFDRSTGLFSRYQYDPADPHSLTHNSVVLVYEDQAGVLWVGTWGGGLNQFDRATERFTHYQHNPADPYSLSNDNVYLFYEDQAGMAWIATDGGGVSILDRGGKPFRHYRSIPGDPNSLSHNAVRAIHQDRAGVVWVGTNSGGLNKLDRDTGTFTHYKHDPADPHSLSNNSVWAVYQDHEGTLWLGTFGGGLNKFDRDTERFIHYVHDSANPHSLSHDSVTSIYQDQTGILWIGTWGGGLNSFDYETEQFTRYQHDPADPDTLSHNQVVVIYQDRADVLWIGTVGGLNRFERETETFTRYHHHSADPNSLGHDSVLSIYEDQRDRLWIATMGGGLNQFDRQNEQFIHYIDQDGLPSNTVFGILEEAGESGKLWLSTTWGLSSFNPQTESFRNYDVSDGLQSNSFLPMQAYYKGDNGEMFFGGANGFNAFYPEQIEDNPHIPPVVITNFQLANKPVPIGGDSVLPQSILESEQLTLSYLDRVLSFEFAALNYRASKKNQYKYKLEGFEDDWNEVDSSRRFATYTNLDPGEYTFRVIGSNNDGVWNEQGASIKITVTPPWWETTWFRGSMLVLLMGLVYSGFRWRVSTVEHQKRQLEMQVTERTQALSQKTDELARSNEQLETAKKHAEAANRAKSAFLASMSHELRTPLNAILGFAQIMRRDSVIPPKQQENLKIINRSGEHLLELINDVLEMSKIEAGQSSLVKSSFDIYNTLDSLEDMIRIRAEKKGLQLIFNRPPDVPPYIKTDERKLRQILINLLSNAVKFTKTGSVTLRVKLEDWTVTPPPTPQSPKRSPTLHFEIEDTGPGIAPDEMDKLFATFIQTKSGQRAQKGAGLGLSISRQFAQLMGGDITVASQVGQGTIFKFDIQVELVDMAKIQPRQPVRRVAGLASNQPDYRILIVDDSPDNRSLLCQLLEEVGFVLQEAVNGQQAVELYESWRPDLIWMDIRMPVMDGYEATKRIKARAKPPHGAAKGQAPVIIALTASAFEEERAVVLAAGCDDFVRKPFREADIFDKMAQHLGVSFTYEDLAQFTEPESDTWTQVDLTPADLAGLPADWIAALRHAAMRCEAKEVLTLIEQIQPGYALPAKALATLADEFQFSKIVALTE